jgi:predicted RNA binding protein YcfA (HicA-like mRNA interferase family)
MEMECQEIPRKSGGSHRKWRNPSREAIASDPDWGNKDLKIGTLRQIIRQLGLDWEQFNTI